MRSSGGLPHGPRKSDHLIVKHENVQRNDYEAGTEAA